MLCDCVFSVYDALTGKIVRRLDGEHRACVRDVSWHPYENNILSTSVSSKMLIFVIIQKNIGPKRKLNCQFISCVSMYS